MVDFNYNSANSFASSLGLHAVPLNICNNMISLLEKEGFFRKPRQYEAIDVYVDHHRVLDIYCNSGSLLYICYLKFMNALDERIEDENLRSNFILQYLLFGFAKDYKLIVKLRQTFYGDTTISGNFYHYNATKQSGIDKKDVKELLNKVKFDVVLGNPPYNDDIYIDFTRLGYNLARCYTLLITPVNAFYNNEGIYNLIRDNLLSLCFYPETTDIFFIRLVEGVSYYLLGKNGADSADITVISKEVPKLNSTRTVTLPRKRIDFCIEATMQSILEKIGSNHGDYYEIEVVPYQNCKYSDYAGTVVSTGGSKDNKRLFTKAGYLQVLSNAQGNSKFCIAGSDDYKIFESKLSYVNTKFVRFCIFSHREYSVRSNDSWNFVPLQNSYDKVYEDKPLDGYTPDADGCYTDKNGVVHCSLYVKYKLTQQEIDVIESVIRERK